MNEASSEFASVRRLVRKAGTWSGVALIGVIVLYLSLASTVPERLAGALRIDAADVYHPWLLGPLCAALCVILIVVTGIAVPLRLRSLGAWCSHLGVVLLAVGSLWYVGRKVSGDCVTVMDRGRWTPIRHVYRPRTFAVYVSRPDGRKAVQTPLRGLDARGGRKQDTDVPLAGGGEGVEIRATGFLPKARVVARWRNVAPRPVPAVVFRVTDSGEQASVVLSPALEGYEQFGARGYVMVYQPGLDPQRLKKVITPSDPNQGPGMPHDLAMFLTGEQIEPTLAVVRPDGSRWHASVEVGKRLAVPLAGRTVEVLPLALLTRAARVYELVGDANEADSSTEAGDPDRPPAGPVLEAEITAGRWKRTVRLPFVYYGHLAAHRIDLPAGQVWLSFSRRREPLAATVQVTKARYQTYPASGIPKDYVCEVDIVAGGMQRSETLSLNHPVQVGPFQLSQGSWHPEPREPYQITLAAASRPGLVMIWMGCIVTCLGFPIAFYVKPLIIVWRGGR